MAPLETPFPSFHYHPHQASGIRWMMDREDHGIYCYGGILADEMGLGKTWETIGLLLNRPVPNTLLLLPPVLQGQWSDALQQAEIPHSILLGSGSKAVGTPTFKTVRGSRTNLHVTLATYDRAARASAFLTSERTFERIVGDEGHVFRNGPRTQRFQALAGISAKFRWLLTGTPVQNRLADFKNLLKWLDACYDKDFDPVTHLARTVMLRRTVADVRETVPAFPEAKPVHVVHPVTMPADGEEKRVFDQLVRRFTMAVATHMDQWMVLELYLRIRQFLAHPQIYKDAMVKKYPEAVKTAAEPWAHSASKMEAFARIMAIQPTAEPAQPAPPTLIFTTFRAEMEYAEAACKAAGYKTWRICGGLGSAGIDGAVRKSREAVAAGESVAVLVQIQAGNAGINLQHLNRIVFLSSHWNPAIVDQAVGRSYRIGQSKPVEVHHVLLADGAEKNLDRHMAGLHLRKRGIARALCGKLACDSAVDVRAVFDELNAVCPDEVEGRLNEEVDEELMEDDVGNVDKFEDVDDTEDAEEVEDVEDMEE